MWGLNSLKEPLLDNNEIADHGAQHIAAVLPPQIPLETLDLGFNRLKTPGISKMLMKALLDCRNLKSLSISGNPIDTSAAKSIAISLAYNRSLRCLSLVHCNIQNEGRRHISAGIASNSQTSLQTLQATILVHLSSLFDSTSIRTLE
jgi:Ran GTPase-activating protein (RanGAP) involved in mRNA processing and transport